MSESILDMTCRCGATLRFRSGWPASLRAEREAFDAIHEACHQPPKQERLYTAEEVGAAQAREAVLVSAPLRRKIADQWAEIETLRVNIAEVTKDRDLILDAKMKVETDNQRLRQRVAEVVAEKNRILNDNREVEDDEEVHPERVARAGRDHLRADRCGSGRPPGGLPPPPEVAVSSPKPTGLTSGVLDKTAHAKPAMCISDGDIDSQRRWSEETFGPGERVLGVVAHIRKELDEVLLMPSDESEWADLLILVIDGATRQGISPGELIRAYHEKMRVNKKRNWPDWRQFSEDEPIEHVREED